MADNPKYNFEEFTLEKCFTNFFIVPDYQREYVWKADQQVARLLSDVSEAYEANADKEYFRFTSKNLCLAKDNAKAEQEELDIHDAA